MTTVLVGAAGLLGVLARYVLSQAAQSIWTIVAVNVAGSFLLGLLLTGGGGLTPGSRTALGVGFLGGFTTFSTFTVQIVADVDGGRAGTAAAYLGASVGVGLLAALGGYALGRALT